MKYEIGYAPGEGEYQPAQGGGYDNYYHSGGGGDSYGGHQYGGVKQEKVVQNPTSVVYFSVANPVYKVDVPMMHEVFGKHGAPQRLYIFHKDGHPQGFCELASVEEAHRCVNELNKQFLFDGGANQLTAKLTSRRSLSVKGNNGCNWDIAAGLPPVPATDEEYAQMQAGTFNAVGVGGKGGGKGGKGRKAGGGGGGYHQPYGGGPSAGYQPYPAAGGKGQPQQSSWGSYDQPPQQQQQHLRPGQGGGRRDGERVATTPVVLFNGLPTITDTTGKRVITTDSLFVLCGCYGDVTKVKFLKEPTQALVEMTSVRQAETVRVHLDKIVLFGTPIRVHGATNDGVAKSKGQPFDTLKYWEYFGSKLHRFTHSRSYENIASPKPTLVVWGYPEGYPTDDLVSVFATYGTVEAFKDGPQGNTGQLILIQLETTDQAAVCLLNLHDLAITGDNGVSNLRINFAKENIHTPSEDNQMTFCNVMVKGLPETFTDEQLYEMFSPFGALKRHTVWKDKQTNRGKGFGLVDYTSVDEAKAAIAALHGTVAPGGCTAMQVTSKYLG